jgi:hypothetical protein
VTSVDESQEEGPLRIDLAIEDTDSGQIDIAISYLLFTLAARFERLCQVLTDTKPPVPDGD